MKYQQIKLAGMILALIVLSGCASLRPRVNGVDFQEGVKASTDEISTLYVGLNGVESDVILMEHASDLCKPRCEHLDGADLTKKQFSVADVKARLAALKVLNAYAKGVAEISSTDSPQVANENLQALGSQVNALSETFGKLGANNNAAKYVEPLSTLAGLILEARLESKRKKAMSKAIITAGPVVKKITDLL